MELIKMIGVSSILTAAAGVGHVLAKGAALLGKVAPLVTKTAIKHGVSVGTAKMLGNAVGIGTQTLVQVGTEKLVDNTLGKLSPTAANITNQVIDGAMMYSAFGGHGIHGKKANAAAKATSKKAAAAKAKEAAKRAAKDAAKAAAKEAAIKAKEKLTKTKTPKTHK